MKKLLKQHGYWNDMQYYQQIVNSFMTGEVYPEYIDKAIQLFKQLPKKYRIELFKSVTFGNWNTALKPNHKEMMFNLI